MQIYKRIKQIRIGTTMEIDKQKKRGRIKHENKQIRKWEKGLSMKICNEKTNNNLETEIAK